ncbi:MAG: DoxX family protein [Terracidiphilus sp.]|jgi:uncharacterized membrane protein YphA (DoxX/SURF4 family)
MNNLDWFAQILLGGIFLFAGLSKIVALRRQPDEPQAEPGFEETRVPRRFACAIALLEIAAALALLVPLNLWRPDLLPSLAASGLALLMVGAGVYRVRGRESAAPAVALFLLALFVIVGHA